MTDRDRLQTIIETALRHGADLSPLNPANGDTWEAHENGLAIFNRDGHMYLFIPVSTVLYGNDLSVLKAALGVPMYQWVARESVLLPDSERLAFICDHLRTS